MGTIVGSIENPIIPLDRAHRVVLGTRLEHLEHVPKRIPAGITSKKADFRRFSRFWETIVESIGNPIIPLDRAHRVVLGTHLEHLEHVPKRIPAGITSKKADFRRFSRFWEAIVGSIGNTIIPLDRARRVVLGTRLEHL